MRFAVIVSTRRFQAAGRRWREAVEQRRLTGARYGWDSAEYERAIDRALTLEREYAAARLAADHTRGLHGTPSPYCPECER